MSARKGAAIAAALVLTLAACVEEEEREPQPGRFVRVETIEASALGDVTTMAGDIQAEQEVERAFRIAGRLVERPVGVGDAVAAGDLLARLDGEQEEAALRAAEAAIVAAEGEVATRQNVFDRHADLLERGFTTRARYDDAQKGLSLALANLADAEARLETARDRLAFTRLVADTDGVVTQTGVEVGEVAAIGAMVMRIARDDGRDAVFDVPARLVHPLAEADEIAIHLAEDPVVTTTGRVRVIAPEADAATGTFRIRIGLDDAPEAMRLRTSVVGTVEMRSEVVISIPASALTRGEASPAVWAFDPATSAVSLRPVEILRFAPDRVVVSAGLYPDEVIVTSGGQALHPGQSVRPIPDREDE